MAVTTTIEEVTTEDATPTEPSYKISAQTGKDTLTFKIKVTAGATIRAIRSRFKPLNRNSGKLIFSRGMVCSTGDRCGSPTARSLAHASPMTTGTITINESEVASEGDGEYEVKAWGEAEGEGWSS